MKKTALLLALLLLYLPCQPILAEGLVSYVALKEEAQVPWQASYMIKGSSVPVYLTPRMPEVMVVPLLEVRPDPFVPRLPENKALWSVESPETDFHFAVAHQKEGQLMTEAVDEQGRPLEATPDVHLYEGFEKEGRYLPGNDLRFSDLTAIARQGFADIGLNAEGRVDWLTPDHLFSYAFLGQSTDDFRSPGFGLVRWPQLLSGIPLAQGAYLQMNIRSREAFSLSGSLVTATSVLAADTPLMPFSAIKALIEQEISAGRLFGVFSLDFRYHLTPKDSLKSDQADAAPVFLAKPVWLLRGLWCDDPARRVTESDFPIGRLYNTRNSRYYSDLLLDATTGEILAIQTADNPSSP